MLSPNFKELSREGLEEEVDVTESKRLSNTFSMQALKEIIEARLRSGELIERKIGYVGFSLMPETEVFVYTKSGKQTKLTHGMPIALGEATAAGFGTDPNKIQPQISDIIWRFQNNAKKIPAGLQVSHRMASDDLKEGTPYVQLVCLGTKEENASRKHCNLYGLMFKIPSTVSDQEPVSLTLQDFQGEGYHGPTCCPHAGTPGGICYGTLKPFSDRKQQPLTPNKR